MNGFFCRLDEAQEPRLVGGKAWSLARMGVLGVRVPEGFVLTHEAFQAFLARGELGRRIHHVLDEESPGGLEGLRRASERIRALVLAAPLPEGLGDELERRAEEVSAGGELIVRSSAVGEDSRQSSFAGQLDSILSVRGREALEGALRACWASYWSFRALAYQRSRGVALEGMGVVVQRLVDSRLAGVLFTQAPAAPERMLVEYCHGQGEALVSGRVEPGRFMLARDGESCERLARPEQPPAPEDEALLFSPPQLQRLAGWARVLEERLGAPQDIEWAIDGAGTLYLVQSRPITTGPQEAPRAAPSSGRRVMWSNANINENFPHPVSPLLYSVAREGYSHYFRNLALALGVPSERVEGLEPALRQMVGVHGGRLYYNLSHIHGFLSGVPGGPRLVRWFNLFVGEDSGAPPPGAGAGVLEEARVGALMLLNARRAWRLMEERIRGFEATVDAFSARCHPLLLADKPREALLEDLRGFLDIRFHRWTSASLADASAMVGFGLLEGLLRRALPAPEERALHGTLLKGLADLVSSAPVDALWELSRRVREEPALRESFATLKGEALRRRVGDFPRVRRALEDYLETWGFRGSEELMLTVPSFQEEPARLLELLKGYVALEGPSPAERLRQQGAEREVVTRRVREALRHRPLVGERVLPGQVRLFEEVLAFTQRAIHYRERARLKQALLYTRLRRIALALGERLVQEGRLAVREDAFFLEWRELESLVAGGAMFPEGVRELVALRRRHHEGLGRMQPSEHFLLEVGGYLSAASADEATGPGAASSSEGSAEGTVLSGTGTCGGRITAPATVMRDVSEAHLLSEGNILVTRQTDPGWAPVLFLVRGLVMERGGMLSHGAIIAREFGIPAVVGVKEATTRIRQGQRLELDGDVGHVRLVD